MRVRSLLVITGILLLSLFLLYLSYGLAGRFSVTSFSLDSLPLTYSVESILLPQVGRNRLTLSQPRLRKSLESLPYIEKAEVVVEGGVLSISGKTVDSGIVITDGERWYFYSDTLSPLSFKDIGALSSLYLILRVDSALMENFVMLSPGSEEKAMMSTLIELKRSSNLITMAEYGNNDSSGYPLSLVLRLDSLSSSLVVENISDADRIEEALGIIESEYAETGALRMGEWTTYVLTGSRLIETR